MRTPCRRKLRHREITQQEVVLRREYRQFNFTAQLLITKVYFWIVTDEYLAIIGQCHLVVRSKDPPGVRLPGFKS